MNQLKRMLKMSPGRVIKKMCCFEEIYTIAYRCRDDKSLLSDSGMSFARIPYHNDIWYADPVLITYQGKDYLFAECFDMRMQKGSIGCAVFNEMGVLSDFQIVIEETYHLSFPMVFRWAERLYMIPESSDNGTLNLYCCNGNILQWSKIQEFPTEKPLVDTVILSCDGKSVELLGSAIHPEDPLRYQWQRLTLRNTEAGYILEEHGAIDSYEDYTRGNRMAGKLAELEGRIILPTQESTQTDYGINLYLNDFNEGILSELQGKKITVDDLLVENMDSKQKIGVHSYAVSERYEVIDIRYFHFSPRNRWRKIAKKLKW